MRCCIVAASSGSGWRTCPYRNAPRVGAYLAAARRRSGTEVADHATRDYFGPENPTLDELAEITHRYPVFRVVDDVEVAPPGSAPNRGADHTRPRYGSYRRVVRQIDTSYARDRPDRDATERLLEPTGRRKLKSLGGICGPIRLTE